MAGFEPAHEPSYEFQSSRSKIENTYSLERFRRTEFSPCSDHELAGFWKSQKLGINLRDALPYLQHPSENRTIDSKLVNELVTFTEESLNDQLFPRALTIRVTSLADACLIHFTVQHPFCDANGMFRITQAYLAVLEGKDPGPIGPRLPLKLREETESGSSLLSPEGNVEPTATRHQAFYAHGWVPLLKGGFTQLKNKCGGPRRIERTVKIPNFVINKLERDAKLEGIQVTRHDLLMAWIYYNAMPEATPVIKRAAMEPPQFSFIMNISKLLQHNPEFHNPWIVVSVPEIDPFSLSERCPIVDIARQIRTTILDARRRSPVEQILNQHCNVRNAPIGPAYWGCREPNIAVSSWTNLPLYDLELVSEEGQRDKPAFVQVGVKACPMLRLAGLYFADGILTWLDGDGFWIQGCLHQGAWEKIGDFQAYQTAEQGNSIVTN
ncbi:hypothetical protein ACMFMG_003737 [Clarireedia jacksonii]